MIGEPPADRTESTERAVDARLDIARSVATRISISELRWWCYHGRVGVLARLTVVPTALTIVGDRR